MFRSSVQYEILDLPLEEGGIEQGTIEGKYLISRAGKLVWITLILKHKPIIYAREVIKFLSKLFENQYEREIYDLYTHYHGDISIFKKDPYSRQSLDKIIEDLFHLYLTLPFKIGSIRGKKISAKSKKIINFAKILAHKTKGHFLLEKLFNEVYKAFKFENDQIADLIYGLVEKEVFLPLSQEKSKKGFPFHF
ncbi:MAG: hypothetical protein JSV62_08055 [Promethearchaeota archaeon]|nr:MAG: hypothetical protein JSV62_08055 [Candidatus Lokiarchaeota archaeon]